MEEQPLDVRGGMALINRRRGLVAVFGVIGLAIGIVYALMHTPMPSATATVILPTTTAAGASCATLSTIQSQVFLASSPTVLADAGALGKKVTASSSADDMLAIKLQASLGPEAVRLVNLVANAYVKEAATLGSNMRYAQIALLTSNAKALQKQGVSVTPEVDALKTHMVSVTSDDIVGAQVFRATSFSKPSHFRVPIHGLYGLLGGLVVGSMIALWKGRRDQPGEEELEPLDVQVLMDY
jgi:hypothetical protein